jgi:lysophospholipase L1-like esterase
MTSSSAHRPLRASAGLTVAIISLALPVAAAQAQVNVHAALNVTAPTQAERTQDSQTPSQLMPSSPAAASQTPAATSSATNDPSLPPPKTLTAKAIDKMKQVARSASDIFSRVPCLPPKGGVQALGSLPHVANKLIAGQPVLIIAFGSSSTQGYGSTAPEFTYPNRLAAQLRRQYPGVNITVVNAGVGGEDAPEMMKRLQTSVIDVHPDLVIWQVGTNAVLRNLDPADTQKLVEDGVARIQGSGSDVVLVDPQYSPRVYERAESANKIVRMLSRVASIRHVGIFPRFQVMREWHEDQSLPVDSFVIADGLHMNDWGYACFAQLLGDDIIKSVGQIKLGVNVPAEVRTYRPM